jgi:hypothetical protein
MRITRWPLQHPDTTLSIAIGQCASAEPGNAQRTMMPSEAWRMLAKSATPSAFSILEMTRGRIGRAPAPLGPATSSQHRSRCATTLRTWEALRMKDAATKSASLATAHRKSALSLAVSAGWSVGGRGLGVWCRHACLQRSSCLQESSCGENKSGNFLTGS